jgi:hypothetical protein
MPATGIGPWTLGKDLTTFTIAPATVAGATSGTTWTVGTAVSCIGLVRRINHQMRAATKDIRPITQVQENQVPISTGNSMQLVNIRINNQTNPLGGIVDNGLYCQVIFHDGSENWSGYFVVTGFESGYDGNEEQIQTLDLAPVAITGGQMTHT